MTEARIRPGRDEDAAAYIRLIGDAWAEYPGIVFDVDAELPELRHLASWFAAQGGAVWLAEGPEGPLGMVATRPLGADQAWEICRMYVARPARGSGLAHRLLDIAEAHARAQGAERLVLWTDTRFTAAHAFYEKRGYVRQGAIRILDDLSKSLEFRYAKPLAGTVVDLLDAAAAQSAERRLSEILIACVEEGAGLGFLRPLSREKARAHWRRIAAEVATGQRLLLVAWAEGVLAGSISLHLALPEDRPHAAVVELLLVDPALRRRRIGEALIRRAEQAADRLGRRLLLAETREGSSAQRLLLRLGYREGGRIPGLSLDETGLAHDAALLWRRVGAEPAPSSGR
ncbi:MAG: GNAT family N-acetyltransferase [Rhodovarius sp.]|nr:GNAT family N-acetyltransferase [Rhodovarius sp.]MCX7933103.1 GNAT family N-acetyltransferase [Rhodovarius sp.]MDW8313582.1 GNAT family N-acetyltransferase [Rhodovarius sp.]